MDRLAAFFTSLNSPAALVVVLIASFLLIIACLAYIDSKRANGLKLEPSWVLAALAPTIIWLFASGKLAEFSGFGVTLKVQDAVAKPLVADLAGEQLDPDVVVLAGKEGTDSIPLYVAMRVSALSFELGNSGYVPGITGEYFAALTRHDFFRYVAFIDNEQRFRGLVPVDQLLSYLSRKTMEQGIADKWEFFVALIERKEIESIPGLITVSIPANSTKKEALMAMAEHRLTELPVVDERQRLTGIIQRHKLIDSVLVNLFAGL